jgi:hypothetical protein
MDTRSYYELIRSQEASIDGEFAWIATLATRNGGVAGRICEVPRRLAAAMIVDHTARIATSLEIEEELARLGSQLRRSSVKSTTSFIVDRWERSDGGVRQT